MQDRFKILQDSRGFVLINLNGEYENHAHLRAEKTCRLIVCLIGRKIVPKSSYLRESCRRLTIDTEYKKAIERKQAKDKEKPAYFNANKGGRL